MYNQKYPISNEQQSNFDSQNSYYDDLQKTNYQQNQYINLELQKEIEKANLLNLLTKLSLESSYPNVNNLNINPNNNIFLPNSFQGLNIPQNNVINNINNNDINNNLFLQKSLLLQLLNCNNNLLNNRNSNNSIDTIPNYDLKNFNLQNKNNNVYMHDNGMKKLVSNTNNALEQRPLLKNNNQKMNQNIINNYYNQNNNF